MYEQSVEDERLANEATVARAAKELARDHIADALLDASRTLARNLYRVSQSHYDRLSTYSTPGKTGYDLATELTQSILITHPIDYRRLIAQANECGDEINEDAVYDSVRQYVETLMKDWGGA